MTGVKIGKKRTAKRRDNQFDSGSANGGFSGRKGETLCSGMSRLLANINLRIEGLI